jgi:hypothetical protein
VVSVGPEFIFERFDSSQPSGRSWLIAHGCVRDENKLESLLNRERREPSNSGEEESEVGGLLLAASTDGMGKQT